MAHISADMSECFMAAEITPDAPRKGSPAGGDAARIQDLLQRLEKHRKSMEELQQMVSQLTSGVGELQDLDALQETVQIVERVQKRTRNLGEDLLDEMLILDNMSGLSVDERASRKVAIGRIDALLEDVDAVKARLGSLGKDLQATRVTLTQERTVTHNTDELSKAVKRINHADIYEYTTAAPEVPEPTPRPTLLCSKQRDQHSEQCASQQLRDCNSAPQLLPLPDQKTWEELTLHLRFRSWEEPGCYTMIADAPGLDAQNISVELSADKCSMHVVGIRRPTAQEAGQMQQQFGARLRRVAQCAPERMTHIRAHLEEEAMKAYKEMGQGRLGRFSESFQLPGDVDRNGISASCRDGVLRVTLCKCARPVMPMYPSTCQSRAAEVNRHPGTARKEMPRYPFGCQRASEVHRNSAFGC